MTHPQGTRQEGRQEARLYVWRCECRSDLGWHWVGDRCPNCRAEIERIEVVPAAERDVARKNDPFDAGVLLARAKLAEQSVTHLREAGEELENLLANMKVVDVMKQRAIDQAAHVQWCKRHNIYPELAQRLADEKREQVLRLETLLTNLQPEHPETGGNDG